VDKLGYKPNVGMRGIARSGEKRSLVSLPQAFEQESKGSAQYKIPFIGD